MLSKKKEKKKKEKRNVCDYFSGQLLDQRPYGFYDYFILQIHGKGPAFAGCDHNIQASRVWALAGKHPSGGNVKCVEDFAWIWFSFHNKTCRFNSLKAGFCFIITIMYSPYLLNVAALQLAPRSQRY